MKILPLLKPSEFSLTWCNPSYTIPYAPNYVIARWDRFSSHQVSDFEVNRAGIHSDIKKMAEREAINVLLNHVYPKDLIRELRDIQCELSLRGRYVDENADLRERLAVVTAQLAERA